MKVEIVTTGSELLLGQIVNTNAAYMSQRLNDLGFDVIYQTTVGDNHDRMKEVLGCDGYNLVQNNGECAGQTVFHFHLHMIPRYKDDEVGLGWKMGELSDADRDEILAKLREGQQ